LPINRALCFSGIWLVSVDPGLGPWAPKLARALRGGSTTPPPPQKYQEISGLFIGNSALFTGKPVFGTFGLDFVVCAKSLVVGASLVMQSKVGDCFSQSLLRVMSRMPSTEGRVSHLVKHKCYDVPHTYFWRDGLSDTLWEIYGLGLASPGTGPMRFVSKVRATLRYFLLPDRRCCILWTPNPFREVLWPALRGEHIFEKRIQNENLTIIFDFNGQNMFL